MSDKNPFNNKQLMSKLIADYQKDAIEQAEAMKHAPYQMGSAEESLWCGGYATAKEIYNKPHVIKSADANTNTTDEYPQFISKSEHEKSLLKKGLAYDTLLGNYIGNLKGICTWDIPEELKQKLEMKIIELEKRP